MTCLKTKEVTQSGLYEKRVSGTEPGLVPLINDDRERSRTSLLLACVFVAGHRCRDRQQRIMYGNGPRLVWRLSRC
jgi:hypothetical protein